jgi:SAM-dependent methyltransferase
MVTPMLSELKPASAPTAASALSYIQRKATVDNPMDAVLWVMDKLVRRWRIDGSWKALSHLVKQPRHRIIDPYIAEPYHDWRLGIKTLEVVRSDKLGLPNQQCHYYVAAKFRHFHRAMRHVSIEAGKDVFLDYGSGKGRVLAMAARAYPFRRVMGVEYSSELNDMARANMQRALARSRRFQCREIEIVTADATQYALPTDVTVVHFYNPFEGEVLAQSLQRIHESLRAAPRKLTIIYQNPIHFERIAHQFPWMVKRLEYNYYYDYKCIIFDCREG